MKHLFIIVALAIFSSAARAEFFNFYSITDNDPTGHAQLVGESQLSMKVSLLEAGQVSLVFKNNGPEDSTVTRIYFDFIPELDLRVDEINEGDGVEFQLNPVSPKNLPAGQSLDYAFISNLGVAAKNPSPKYGINPYDSLELIMSYDGSRDFIGALGSEELRVGLHVQAFDKDFSESFVNVIPEPASMGMMGTGIISAMLWRNKGRKRRKETKAGRSLAEIDDIILSGAMDRYNPNALHWVEVKTHKESSKPRTRFEAALRKVTSS